MNEKRICTVEKIPFFGAKKAQRHVRIFPVINESRIIPLAAGAMHCPSRRKRTSLVWLFYWRTLGEKRKGVMKLLRQVFMGRKKNE
ncbi:MAG: hypothetical protein D6730_02310 [Bacteroidetes bacterium]|nr:MAG: hypothetical protein D6730_02310 [Bacteroidota bacterium]